MDGCQMRKASSLLLAHCPASAFDCAQIHFGDYKTDYSTQQYGQKSECLQRLPQQRDGHRLCLLFPCCLLLCVGRCSSPEPTLHACFHPPQCPQLRPPLRQPSRPTMPPTLAAVVTARAAANPRWLSVTTSCPLTSPSPPAQPLLSQCPRKVGTACHQGAGTGRGMSGFALTDLKHQQPSDHSGSCLATAGVPRTRR